MYCVAFYLYLAKFSPLEHYVRHYLAALCSCISGGGRGERQDLTGFTTFGGHLVPSEISIIDTKPFRYFVQPLKLSEKTQRML